MPKAEDISSLTWKQRILGIRRNVLPPPIHCMGITSMIHTIPCIVVALHRRFNPRRCCNVYFGTETIFSPQFGRKGEMSSTVDRRMHCLRWSSLPQKHLRNKNAGHCDCCRMGWPTSQGSHLQRIRKI